MLPVWLLPVWLLPNVELFINLFKAWVGAASADAFIHMGVHCWDMAAAALIVKEAGGACLHTDGSEFNLMGRQIVAAASEELAKEIVSKIKIYNVNAEFVDHCPL